MQNDSNDKSSWKIVRTKTWGSEVWARVNRPSKFRGVLGVNASQTSLHQLWWNVEKVWSQQEGTLFGLRDFGKQEGFRADWLDQKAITEKVSSIVRAKSNSGCLAGSNLKKEKVAKDRAV